MRKLPRLSFRRKATLSWAVSLAEGSTCAETQCSSTNCHPSDPQVGRWISRLHADRPSPSGDAEYTDQALRCEVVGPTTMSHPSRLQRTIAYEDVFGLPTTHVGPPADPATACADRNDVPLTGTSVQRSPLQRITNA
jgi:hypothetical protein